MHETTKEYINQALKGVWSPFFRRRIRREIIDHIKDVSLEKNINEPTAVKFLGEANEANFLYQKLMYRKLKSDSIFYGGIFSFLFISGLYFTYSQIEEYRLWSLSKYERIEKNYKKEVLGINHFRRSKEKKNAALFLDAVFNDKDKLTSDNFLSKLHEFDHWDPAKSITGDKREYFKYTVISPRRITQLAKFATVALKKAQNKLQARKNYIKVAELIYSTETMAGYRVANNMIDKSLFDKKGKLQFYFKTRANRSSGTTWGVLNLMPQIVSFEKTFKNVNYYNAGICHHSYDFWFSDILYQEFTKASFPFEKNWNEEHQAIKNIKNKMKLDCRLSFLDITSPPKPINRKSMWVTGPEEKPFRFIYENLIVAISQVPYIRNLAGRYLVYRTSISIQGDGEKIYSKL